MITNMLWPFKLKMAVDCLNIFMGNHEGISLKKVFSGVHTDLDFHDVHVFKCPVFILCQRLQSGIGGPLKWDPWECVGIYLG